MRVGREVCDADVEADGAVRMPMALGCGYVDGEADMPVTAAAFEHAAFQGGLRGQRPMRVNPQSPVNAAQVQSAVAQPDAGEFDDPEAFPARGRFETGEPRLLPALDEGEEGLHDVVDPGDRPAWQGYWQRSPDGIVGPDPGQRTVLVEFGDGDVRLILVRVSQNDVG